MCRLEHDFVVMQLAFRRETNKQLRNSKNKPPFPKICCGLNLLILNYSDILIKGVEPIWKLRKQSLFIYIFNNFF